MHAPRRFPPSLAHELGYYLYAYVDPRDEAIFYIGKGTGDRAFHHLDAPAESDKTRRIAEIRAAGLAPRIDVLVYGLTEKDAYRIEAVCIDLVGLRHLTNRVTGHRAAWGGRRTAAELIETLAAAPTTIDDPVIAINVNQSYYFEMAPEDLYEFTRGVWRVSRERARTAQYAFAVCEGLIKEVYRIDAWHAAGSTPYHRRTFEPGDLEDRSEFTGRLAPPDVRDRYRGFLLPSRHSQNPIRYFNC